MNICVEVMIFVLKIYNDALNLYFDEIFIPNKNWFFLIKSTVNVLVVHVHDTWNTKLNNNLKQINIKS